MPLPSTRAALFALEHVGIKLGLDQIRALVTQLERPDRAYPSIIIAGTNGKGSVTAMIERGLRAAGYRTGRFTSPHLVNLEERFAVDGEPISAEALDAAAGRILKAATHLPAPPSFFEATTAMALDVFREAGVEYAVLEVGLGGRLDATNVVDSTAAVITSVDFDHEQYLGHTLEAIAREKAGVIKPGAVVVLSPNEPEVEHVVASSCRAVGASLIRAREGVVADVDMVKGRAHITVTTPLRSYPRIQLALCGRHQVDNAITAIRMLETLASDGPLTVGPNAVIAAIEDVVWPARLETLMVESVEVLLDGAHNPAGARALSSHVLETYHRRLPMVVGAMRDKSLDALVLALAAGASHFIFTSASTPRAATPEELSDAAARIAPDTPRLTEREPVRAVSMAAAFGSPVIVAGSLYLAGEVRARRS